MSTAKVPAASGGRVLLTVLGTGCVGPIVLFVIRLIDANIDTSRSVSALLALAGVYATIAGFMIAGVILVAGASGKPMARVRKKAAERKIDFVSLLMVAIALMVTSAIVLPFSSIFIGRIIVNYLAAVFATLPIGGVALSLLAIAAALRE